MEDRILHAMAADLGIFKYENESERQYCNRVLYSAMASWIKAVALDQPVTSEQMDNPGVSRRHISDKCTAILNEVLKRFPESKLWFESEKTQESPIAFLLSRLLRHGDILQVGFETNLILAGRNETILSDRIKCRKGEVLSEGTFYSGIAMLQKVQKSEVFEPEAVKEAAVWFEDYIKSVWWKETEIDDNVQYFNACKRTKNNHLCWQTERPEPVKGVWLIRRTIYKNGYEYFLIRKDEGLYKHQIDSFLQEMGEHRRFMIAMRYMADNAVPVQAERYSDHISLNLRIHLPQKESTLLETYAWPHNAATDRLEWDMDEAVWRFIKPHLYNLGLKLT
jgi:hypothetical protein